MTVFLTGCTGYLGSRIARRLLAEGREVLALIRDPARLPPDLQDRVRTLVADLVAPVPAAALAGHRADVLIHAAGEVRATEPRQSLFAANEAGTHHAVAAALSLGVRRIVIISSLEAAGPGRIEDGDVFENLVPAPAGDYAESKLAAETEAARLGAAAAVPVVILRPGNIYGDGEPGIVKFLVDTLVQRGREAVAAEWWNHRFQPVHVDDVTAAVMTALTRGESVYNVTDGSTPTVGRLYEDIAWAAAWRGLPAPDLGNPPERAPDPGRVHHRHRIDRAQRELGWEPAISFRRGVLDLIDQLGLGLPRIEVADAIGVLSTLLLNTPSAARPLNRDMGGGMGFVHANADRFPPLDLLGLAATLESRRWPVKVLDGGVLPLAAGDLANFVTTHGIHCVVAEVNLPTFEDDLAFLRELRRSTRARVVAKTALTDPRFHARLLRENATELVVTGECDLTIPEVLLGRDRRGTVRLQDGGIVAEPEERLQDLDRLPIPARHLVSNAGYTYHLLPRPFTTMQSSRGCPYSCGYYCPYPLTQGTAWRARSAAHVVAEIEACAALGIRSILFRDATFTLSRSRTLEICRLIVERGLDLAWWCETRINCLDDELLHAMARAGCRGINFGIESGDDEVLARGAKQGVNVKRIREVLEATRRAGVHSHLLVVVGLPSETRESIGRTWSLLAELPAQSLGVTGVTPFPGTRLWDDAEHAGWILSTDWSRYGGNDTVMVTGHLDAEDIRFAGQMLDEHFRLTRNPADDPAALARHRAGMEAWLSAGR